MRVRDIGRTIGASILAIAALNATASLSQPDGKPAPPAWVAVATALLLLHAVAYWYGAAIRERIGLTRYVAGQAALIFGAGLSHLMFPIVAVTYVVLTAEVIGLAPAKWSSAMITVGAVLLFTVNCVLAFDLYRGASAGLVLALSGAVMHAFMALRRPAATVVPAANGSPLTAREMEVLRMLAHGGDKNSRLANDLAISERTVKAHLGSIYQKLGVESRTGAVAAARRLGLI
jgi:DNA-binding CsgD family transcriptional regulator